MTKTTYVNAIYLGNFASVDTNESDYDAEHEAALTGVTVDHGTLQVVSLRLDDKDHNGTISDDECNPYCDKVTYDIGTQTKEIRGQTGRNELLKKGTKP